MTSVKDLECRNVGVTLASSLFGRGGRRIANDVILGRSHAAPRSFFTPAAEPASVGHRSLQSTVPVLHAGAGLRVAAAREPSHLRGDRRDRRRVHAAWRGPRPAYGG